MRKSEEWVDRLGNRNQRHEFSNAPALMRNLVSNIQADALRHAATLIVTDGNPQVALDKIIEAAKEIDGGHDWFVFKADAFRSCRVCGYVERRDGANPRCGGKPKLRL